MMMAMMMMKEEEEEEEEGEEEEEDTKERLWVMGYGLEASCMCIGISRHASRGPLECSFEATWEPFRSLWGASWGFLGASGGPREGLWGPLRAILGLPGAPGGGKLEFQHVWSPSWAPLGAVLEPSWAVLGPSWAVFGPSWAVLEPSWRPLGPSWDDLWGLLGRLGPFLARKAEHPKNIQKPMENQ